MSDGPILFGDRRQQALLEEIHLVGSASTLRQALFTRLERSGLVLAWYSPGCRIVTFDRRHPGYGPLREVLASLTGAPGAEPVPPPGEPPPHAIDPLCPLGHQSPDALRILNVVTYLDEPTVETVARRLPDVWPHNLKIKIAGLVRDRALAVDPSGRVALGPNVPASFARLVEEIAKALGQREPPAALAKAAGPRPAAFNPAADGAPRLFGTDARLRNLMALAKHGPLDYRDLRRITGAGHVNLEGEDDAPTGRGSIARAWKGEEFACMMLDPAYPVAEPLRRLLLRLEEAYPLPPVEPIHPRPEPPPMRPWVGARTELFRDIIPTTILTSIGVHGWTYEALCDAILANDRWNIKRSMQRLEREGVLQGDRPRRPGADVRVVTISEDFPARAELEALLRAYVEAWPAAATAVRRGFEKIARKSTRSKAHLEKRGLWPY